MAVTVAGGTVYTTDYGQTIRVETLCDQMGLSTGIVMKMKRVSDSSVEELDCAAVGDTSYSVDVTIVDGWLADKAGRWKCQIEATFGNALIHSDYFWLTVLEPECE